jgi:hypothetical protein
MYRKLGHPGVSFIKFAIEFLNHNHIKIVEVKKCQKRALTASRRKGEVAGVQNIPLGSLRDGGEKAIFAT